MFMGGWVGRYYSTMVDVIVRIFLVTGDRQADPPSVLPPVSARTVGFILFADFWFGLTAPSRPAPGPHHYIAIARERIRGTRKGLH